jgi:G3E family GTPase
VIQAVHEIFEVVESDHVWDRPAAQRTSKVVVIGRRLNQAALQRGVEDCVAD